MKAIFYAVMALSSTAISAPLDYGKMLASQRQCDAASWQAPNWVSTLAGTSDARLNAKGHWPLLSEVRVVTGTGSIDKKMQYEGQNYQVKYTWYGTFTCGKSKDFVTKSSKATWSVLSTQEKGEAALLAKESAIFLSSSEGDPEDGWKCYSDFQDFLRNPDVVDVEKLCEGEPDAKKDETRAEIARVAEMLRSQRYAQCKKSKTHLAQVPVGGKAWIDGPANIRSKNSSTSAIVMDLADDAQVEVVQQKGSWFLIKSDGKQGWTAKQNLLPQSIRAECRDWEVPR